MSGGFFRGTSADQDTRFSNKQAKLLKSQKFASELEHTVDMTKVKLDVIRPWIANRVTELLGFEDEVIINFIFGLLDGKDVDGKQIQIQLTGFMEKNTRKFMKELWSLLLSAQKNISGVPQQFLAAKEEESKKMKAESDRISREIQQKREKENRESEWEIKRKLGDENDDSRVVNHASDASSKHLLPNASNTHVKDNEVGRHKLQGQERFTKFPVEDRSPSLDRNSSSPRPRSKSFSNTRSSSRSRSSERFRSRSISKSPRRQRRSPLIEKRSHSPVRSSRYRRSPQNTRSPSRRRSPYLRRRSPSPIRRRSPTPVQRRSLSPQYRKSPFFVRRRSPSPRWRSPYVRQRSPRVRRRLPSPSRHRSPSPPRRRSPRYHRRSPAASYRSRDVKVSPYKRSRSRSPYPSQSPPHGGHTLRSLSKEPGKHDHASDRYQHEDEGHGPRGRRSPDVRSLEGEDKHSGGGQKAESSARPLSTSLRSPQRDVMPQPEEPYRGQYKSPVYARKTNVNEDGSEQDQHGTRRHVERPEIGDASKKANQHSHMVHDGSESLQATEFREHSPAALGANSTPGSEDHLELSKSMKRSHSPRRYDGFSQDDYSNKPSRLSSLISEDIEYEPGRPEGDASQDHALVRQSSLRRHTGDDLSPEKALNGANMSSKRGHRTKKFDDDDYSLDYKRAVVKRSIKNVEHTRRVDTYESDDEENESSRHHSSDSKKQKETIERKHKGHDDSDALSQDDERKEAKRRRKEEKKMQKEEKRLRHEERHRRREEKRAIKMKGRSDDADSREKSHKDGAISDGDEGHEISHRSDAEEPELAQRNLEIELRKKALESLRAKNAISH